MNMYACESKSGEPLGYVKADSLKAAQIKALAKHGIEFGFCYLWKGVL